MSNKVLCINYYTILNIIQEKTTIKSITQNRKKSTPLVFFRKVAEPFGVNVVAVILLELPFPVGADGAGYVHAMTAVESQKILHGNYGHICNRAEAGADKYPAYITCVGAVVSSQLIA